MAKADPDPVFFKHKKLDIFESLKQKCYRHLLNPDNLVSGFIVFSGNSDFMQKLCVSLFDYVSTSKLVGTLL